MITRIARYLAGIVCVGLGFCWANVAWGQSFQYEAKPRASSMGMSYAEADPAPRMMEPSEAIDTQSSHSERGSLSPSQRRGGFAIQAAYRSQDYPYYAPRRSRHLTAQRDSFTSNFDTSNSEASIEPIPEELPPAHAEHGPLAGHFMDESYVEGEEAFDESSGGECENCGACGECQGGFFRCFYGCLHRSYLFSPALWQNFNEFGGVQAFKGPMDQGVNGNFGFHKGVNWATPLCDDWGIGYQLGGTIAVSDLEGGAGAVNKRRDQYFVTSGVFRRANCNQGLQGGAVLDYLHDDFYLRMNLLQIRSEVSFLCNDHEVGVWSAVHASSDTQTAPGFLTNQRTVTWRAHDQYNLFYRHRFCNGGVGRMWVGLDNHADVIFGSDATAPLSERWAIQGSYNYLWPRSNSNSDVPSSIQESWNVMISLVWYPGYKVPNACFNPYRPLFTVADNGSFMLTEKR